MQTIADQTISEEAGSGLQLKKSLLPINKYAAREGVSTDTIERCGKLGVVQIRKHKDKTFVVDVPLSQYAHIPQTIEEPAKINESIDTADEIGRMENLYEPLRTHKHQRRKTTGRPQKFINETAVSEETPESSRILQNYRVQFTILTAKAKSKRAWQITALVSIALLFAAVLFNLWLYTNHKTRLHTLEQFVSNIYKTDTSPSQPAR